MRVAIIGNSGSGKSTLARHLACLHSLVALDLDRVAWEPGRIAEPRESAAAISDVSRFCDSNPDWVIEGCYASLVKIALLRSPLLLFIDPGLEACLGNCRERPWEPHKYPSKEAQDEKLKFLLLWVGEYYRRGDDQSLRAHQDLFDAYPGPKRRLSHRLEPTQMSELSRLCTDAR